MINMTSINTSFYNNYLGIAKDSGDKSIHSLALEEKDFIVSPEERQQNAMSEFLEAYASLYAENIKKGANSENELHTFRENFERLISQVVSETQGLHIGLNINDIYHKSGDWEFCVSTLQAILAQKNIETLQLEAPSILSGETVRELIEQGVNQENIKLNIISFIKTIIEKHCNKISNVQLNFSNNPDIISNLNPTFTILKQKNIEIKKLDLSKTNASIGDMQTLIDLMKKCSLESLIIKNLSGECAAMLLKALRESLMDIKRLDISNSPLFTDAQYDLTNWITDNKALKEIHLKGCEISYPHSLMEAMGTALKANNSINLIDLTGSSVDVNKIPQGFEKIFII